VATSYEDAQQLLTDLKRKHERRQYELSALRRYWQGNYWADQAGDRSGVANVSQLFRDLKSNQSDVGPDLKIVHNLLQEICVKYQTFLAPVPMIRTFRDPPFSEQRRKQATLKERVLYGTWWMNRVARRMGEIGWYLPLMGDCFIGVWPDYDQKLVRMMVRTPEGAHPVKSAYDGKLDAIIFRRDESAAALARAYPNFQADKVKTGRSIWSRSSGGGDKRVEIVEFSDDSEYVMWAGGQELKRINHGFGFNLYGQMGFIPVPGGDYNHGAVEQIVSMVEMGNAGYSLMFQAMLENVFPTMVIKDPGKAPVDILRGPGSVIPVGPGGDVTYLTPPVQALGIQMAFLRENADKVLESASMPRVSLGQSPATSIVTGAAVNELQGAGSGSTIEMVQGTEIGPGLSDWNEKALFIYANEFKDDSIPMYAIERSSGMELSGRGNAAAFTFRGSEIVGSYRNEVVFNPHYNDHEKLVMALQALGADIVSKEYVRQQIGISDNDEMVEAIYGEKIEEALLAAIGTAFAATPEPTPQAAEQAEAKVAAFIDVNAAGTPHPLLTMGQTPPPVPTAGPSPLPAGPPPGPPGGPASLAGGPGLVAAPPLLLPPGAPAPGGGPPAPGGPPPPVQPGPTATAELGQVQTDLLGVQNIQGRVFLIGEIVQRGQTSGPIEVAVTVRADEQTITAALPQYHFDFKVVPGVPGEPHVEVTPGTTPQAPAPEPAPAGAPS
jgi:hypothetical protein